MTLMSERETVSDVMEEIIERAGGLRPLSRLILRESGVRVQASRIGELRDGTAEVDRRIPDGLIRLWPDLAARLYVAMGITPTGAVPQMDEEFERIAALRGIPIYEILSTLLDEEIRRLSRGNGK
jgi:hypothetical protein